MKPIVDRFKQATNPAWALSACVHSSVSALHSRTVRWNYAETVSLPLGEKTVIAQAPALLYLWLD